VQAFLNECHMNVTKVIQKLGIDSEKTKKQVEQSVIIHHINSRMEQKN